MPTDAMIEAAAKAIFGVVEPRLNRTKPRTWDSLPEERRKAYRSEAKAALEAAYALSLDFMH